MFLVCIHSFEIKRTSFEKISGFCLFPSPELIVLQQLQEQFKFIFVDEFQDVTQDQVLISRIVLSSS